MYISLLSRFQQCFSNITGVGEWHQEWRRHKGNWTWNGLWIGIDVIAFTKVYGMWLGTDFMAYRGCKDSIPSSHVHMYRMGKRFKERNAFIAERTGCSDCVVPPRCVNISRYSGRTCYITSTRCTECQGWMTDGNRPQSLGYVWIRTIEKCQKLWIQLKP